MILRSSLLLKALPLLLFLGFFTLAFSQEEPDEIAADAPIMKAVKANNLKEVMRLVEAGEPFIGDPVWGERPVDCAVQNDYREIALYLLKKGARGHWGFYHACDMGDLKWIEVLWEYGYRDSEALIPAVENGNMPLVKFLVGNGVPINVSQKRKSGLFSKYYVSPIELAFDGGRYEIAAYLIANGADPKEAFDRSVSVRNYDLAKKAMDIGNDPDYFFLESISRSCKEMAAYALSKGASKAARDEEGRNALLIAVKNGSQEMIDYALNDLQLDINSVTNAKENALMLACSSGNIQLVLTLLDKSTNPEFENNAGETALFYAARSGKDDILQPFIDKKVDLGHVNHAGNNILLEAAERGSFLLVKRLIDLGVDYKLINKQGYGVMAYFVSKQSEYRIDHDMVNFFLEKGLDVNASGPDKQTLVYKAVLFGDLPYLDFLRSKGGNMNPKNSQGQRPATKKPEVIRYLIENGADINLVDDWHSTYMCDALTLKDLELAAYLISKKIDLEQACYFDEPVLIKAIESENLEFVRFLVENNANVHVQDYFDRSAIEYALEKKNQAVIDYLRSKGAMTKDERNKYIVARMADTQQLNQNLDAGNLEGVLTIVKKYPDLSLTPEEVGKMAALAATNSSLELLQIAMEDYHFGINQTVNFQEQSVLFIAAQQHNKDFVVFLVNKGADVLKEDGFGKTASDYAETKEIKTYLKEKMKR